MHKQTNFKGVRAIDVREKDPLATMLGFVGITNQQVIRIQADGFYQLEGIRIDGLRSKSSMTSLTL